MVWFRTPEKTARRFAADEGGNVMSIFTITAPVLALIVAGAVDYSGAYAYRSDLQGAADAAAIGAARELHMVDTSEAQVKAAAQSIVNANLADWSADVTVRTSLLADGSGVKVDLQGPADGMMLAGFGLFDTRQSASATANVVGQGNICLLGMEPESSGAIRLEKDSKITAPACSVFSNSTDPWGLKTKDNATLTAEFICSAGGAVGSANSFSPEPEVDCPRITDPLGSRPEPAIGPCTEVNYVLEHTSKLKKKDALPKSRQAVTLKPGTYCGGIVVDGPYAVTLEPGEYIIKNGMLDIGGGASLTGEYVGIYFKGGKSALYFRENSKIDLGAPATGDMAGILFWADEYNDHKSKHIIESRSARNLLGTIYLPRGDLEVIAKASVADQSAYTIIIARKLTLDAGPNLVLNTDYNATDVPVPDGVGPAVGRIALTQ